MNRDVVSIVATGPSAIDCGALEAEGTIIAVNEAMNHVPQFHIGLTMDGLFAMNTLPKIMEAFNDRIYFVRLSAHRHMVEYTERRWPDVKVYCCDITATDFYRKKREWQTNAFVLNGDHSGYNALALAHYLQPKEVRLYGFDLGAQLDHFFGGYPWHGTGSRNTHAKFEKWRNDMHAARVQFDDIGCRVLNMNPRSSITAFEKVPKC